MTKLLNKEMVDQFKLDAIRVLQNNYVRPDTNQPLWVTYKKYESWQNKDDFLANNCLPAHLAVLPDVKKIAPNATVVIGILHDTDKASFKRISDHIRNLHPIYTQEPDKYFHAWIKLNTNTECFSILDFISNDAVTSTNGYLDTPLINGHIEILNTEQSVYDFHAKYISNKFHRFRVSRTPDSNTKEFLENFSRQQNISISQAFGTLGFSST
ncbi:hypothetical protein [Vibrio parahaemolyticus]|uniref:hypothetical protein n=1 Tax=Vibrio parahaemolyticus TaxID=670 RepID=UPI0005443E85|nr:hypothetical protein [Vibrio parahaemolyticus]EHR6475069.1 hypothetical protein [Vibrio parahaemolyticus]KHF19432.1 hypothetical protein PO81_13155 [Vibrio parahaemolyticus]MBE3686866.1 hypothetical protein [Vibrio parahaemolyticus]